MRIVGVSLLVSVVVGAGLRLLYYRNDTFFLLCTALSGHSIKPEAALHT